MAIKIGGYEMLEKECALLRRTQFVPNAPSR